ncbi:MAG: MFS transporter [Pseudomonadota bacterium]
MFAYALPAFALAVLYLPLFTYVTPYYESIGVDVAALGAVWIAIRMFDAVSDPAIGWISDRTPERWGRRRVWLVLSVPVILLGTWQAFVPPEGAGLAHAAFWLFIVTLGWTMAQTPYAAWGAEIAPDYTGRTRVTAWRESVVLVGTLAATVLYFQAGEGGAGLRALALCVMVALPIGVLVALWRVPDRAVSARKISVADGWEAMKANAPFRCLLAAWFVNGAANGLPVTLFLFFVADYLMAGDEMLGGVPVAAASLLSYFLAAILAVPFWSWLAGRTSKHRAWGVAMLWACAIFAWALTLGPGDAVQFLAISILTGLAFGADLSLPPAIQADVVELDTRRTGAARAGLFFAIWQVVTKAALALSSGLALIVLGFAGFSGGADNEPFTLGVLVWLYAGVPIALKLWAVWLMWDFPLDRTAVDSEEAAVFE